MKKRFEVGDFVEYTKDDENLKGVVTYINTGGAYDIQGIGRDESDEYIDADDMALIDEKDDAPPATPALGSIEKFIALTGATTNLAPVELSAMLFIERRHGTASAIEFLREIRKDRRSEATVGEAK